MTADDVQRWIDAVDERGSISLRTDDRQPCIVGVRRLWFGRGYEVSITHVGDGMGGTQLHTERVKRDALRTLLVRTFGNDHVTMS